MGSGPSPIQMAKGYFLPLLRRLAQPYGPLDAQDRPFGSQPRFFSYHLWLPSFSGATRTIVQLATTRRRSLTAKQRELKALSPPFTASFPGANPPPPQPLGFRPPQSALPLVSFWGAVLMGAGLACVVSAPQPP